MYALVIRTCVESYLLCIIDAGYPACYLRIMQRRSRTVSAAQLSLCFSAPVADEFGAELFRIQTEARAQSRAIFAPYRYLMNVYGDLAA